MKFYYGLIIRLIFIAEIFYLNSKFITPHLSRYYL